MEGDCTFFGSVITMGRATGSRSRLRKPAFLSPLHDHPSFAKMVARFGLPPLE
jgi:hypothetical protein